MRPHSPSFRLPQPSFRPPNRHSGESRNPVQHCVNHPYAVAAPNRHSGASRNLVQHCEPSVRRSGPQPSFRLAPESRPCGHIYHHPGSPNRHSGPSRSPGRAVTFTITPDPPTVIPAKAGIYARRPITDSPNRHPDSPQPSFRRKPESRPGRIRSRPRPGGPPTVIPAKAGIYARRLHYRLPQPSYQLPSTVIPAQPGIQGVLKPYRQPRQSFQLAGLTSRNPHTTRNPSIPPASHLPPRQPSPGDSAPSHLSPLPGILDVGDAGSRFGCPPPTPSAPPNPKSRKFPPK